ncbi:uncharacterized protein LOC110855028 [Folsomia candida]|uniref:Uncharacterized protein n=1 Tax=Folsomia candida TaxID=158441 RepID=A0A226DT83_FOLCA|nr:uncharacterized protein LOC110855028 [Folsomia candida]OXA48692.1 hypothetical protein Fcan01_16688 [Folsomia candida]
MVEIKSAQIILKIVSLVVLFIAMVVGCHAHFNNTWTTLWGTENYPEVCKKTFANCPSSAMGMERTFVAFTIIIFVLSIANIVVGFLIDPKKNKIPDTGYHAVAGVILLIAGCLMIAAARGIDSAMVPEGIPSEARKSLWKGLKYSNKLAGGSMAIIDGLLYVITAGVIFKY